MTEITERITPGMSEEEVLGVILDEIMARAEPDVAEAICFCAIPHWFNGEFIAWLRGEELKPSQRSREILAALTELTFVGPYHERGWAYHENVRDLLLYRWREIDGEEFEELSGRAARYFGQKAEVATDEERDEWEREHVYHLLAADPDQGFKLFSSMFNRALDFYQLSTCALLLELAKEQGVHLDTVEEYQWMLMEDPEAFAWQRELVTRIMHTIAAGESCSIVGMAGVGKSNLFRFLIRPNVRQRYLGKSWGKYLFLYIDTYSLKELSEWGLYELLLRRMVEATEGLKIESQWTKLFNDLHQQAVWPEKRPLARGYLERGVKNLCQRLGFRLVFLFDEFDEIFRQVDTRFFLSLRALRDEHKYRLSYVVATRDELSRIRKNMGEFESFYELFSLNTFGLGPYSKVDARKMVQRLAMRGGVTVTDDDTNLLLEVSGRHPGLLRAAFWALSDGKIDKSGDIYRQLLDDPDIQAECTKIWDSIGEDEQMALADVAAGRKLQQLDQGIVQLLRLKGLAMENRVGQVTIFCRLFEDFVNQPEVLAAMDIRLDRGSRKVWMEGEGVSPGLTAEEFALLSYLYERRGEICSKGELEALYLKSQNVDTLIDQLQKKIESDPRRPKYLITARGRGFKLARATPVQL
jgi:DNA-binding winged helix-turn-helix (wHTH) protein